jgi:hypothetical protein
MKPDDEAARKARAKRLREQIDELEKGVASTKDAQVPPVEETAATPASPKPESPREFIHRRMRELKNKEADT